MLWRTLLGVGVAALAGAGVLFVLIVTGVLDTSTTAAPPEATPFGTPLESYNTPQPTEALPPASDAPITRLVIERFGIDAPVQVKGVDANNVMISPDGPQNVAWYDFSGKPGHGSNAVFSGHVDYIDYGAAVFWHLTELVAGDRIDVHLEDGTIYSYAVEGMDIYSSAPTQEELHQIVGPSTTDVVTLITCSGDFNPATGQYDQRAVVRAKRILDAPAPEAPIAAP
jgi:LPXTG-site transpeptidase (sortase) family protein